MDAETLIPRLVSQYGYPTEGARLVANRLISLQPSIYAAFVNWWEHGREPDVNVQGYTVFRLRNEHSMTVIAALLTLDWLIRTPDQALASLARGHDTVYWNSTATHSSNTNE